MACVKAFCALTATQPPAYASDAVGAPPGRERFAPMKEDALPKCEPPPMVVTIR
jgi:hypothetical protein